MKKTRQAKPASHASGETARPESPALEGRTPLPEELSGKASGTDDDLVTLFDGESGGHLADGFRGGSGDEPRTPRRARGAK